MAHGPAPEHLLIAKPKQSADRPVAERISEHGITRSNLDSSALRVINELNANGFQAYLVGGCVRDALCGIKPKDFDVATDAPLDKVNQIFWRARIVGRRFPIAHVRFGRDLIEVSTFRQADSAQVVHDQQGMILRDNAFGTMQEDAFRRDFTINALYFDPQSNEIIDYVGGVGDIKEKRLRFIGDTPVRLAEDPVRILRALRFSAKLNFDIDPEILQHLDNSAERLRAIPPARLFDEFLKLFFQGRALPIWQLMRQTPLAKALFPTCNPHSELVEAAMRNTDDRIRNDASITPGFLVAVLLWEDYCARKNQRQTNEEDPAYATLRDQQEFIAIPRRFGTFAKEMWSIQERLIRRSPRTIERLGTHKRFRAGYDFLCLRGAQEDDIQVIAQWWTDYQEADQEGKTQMIGELPKSGPRRKRKSRGKRKASAGEGTTKAVPENSSP